MATKPVLGRTCKVCNTWKPRAQFRLRSDGQIDSWCKACHQEEKNRVRTTGGNDVNRYMYADNPAMFSYAVCRHVAAYVQRKATEFEQETGQEAPPHLQALLSITTNIAAQHNEHANPQLIKDRQRSITAAHQRRRRLTRTPEQHQAQLQYYRDRRKKNTQLAGDF